MPGTRAGAALFALGVLVAASDSDGVAQDAPIGREAPEGIPLGPASELPPGVDDPARLAIEAGLRYLERDLATQVSGRVSLGDPRYEAPVGLTALAALAFMAGGSSPTRGPQQRALVRTLDYLIAHQIAAGEPTEGFVTAAEEGHSRNHSHGLAVLALTQAYTLSPKTERGKRIADAISLGVRRIEIAQGPDGGWYYDPEPVDVNEGSVTICMLQALRGARNAGFQVDGGVVARAVAYVEGLQEEDGGFIYSKQEPRSSVALTAASLSTLHAIGIYDGPAIEDGYVYIWRHLAIRDEQRAKGLFGGESRFPYYERFYLAQALWQNRDELVFRRWAAEETPRVLRDQKADGSWTDRRYDDSGQRIEGRYGSAYATAMNVLYLSVPENLLPIFQR